AAELEHRQHGRVAELELQGESDDVESGQRSAALDRKQWLALRLERRLHVGPGHEDALAGDVGPLVEHVVEQPETDVAHADFVRVRERERPFHPQLRQFLADGVQLAADVARWLLERSNVKTRSRFPIQRLMNAMRQAHADGWFIVFDTLTLADDRLEAFYDNLNGLHDYF